MPTILIKADRDSDFYVGWSMIVEAPVWWGDRTEVLGYLAESTSGDPLDDPDARIARADMNGTSAAGGFAFFGRWDDEGFMYEQRGILPRRHLTEACRLLEADNEVGVWDLLEPIEDGMEVRRG